MDITILIVILALFGVSAAYAQFWTEKRISDRVRIKIGGMRRRQHLYNEEFARRLIAVESGIVAEKESDKKRDPLLKSSNPMERSEARHVAAFRKDVVTVNGEPTEQR